MFVATISKYPPSELFGGVANPTTQQKKSEQRITTICEDLYKIDSQTLSQLRTAYNGFSILPLFFDNLKPEYFIDKAANLQYHLEVACADLDKMHNKDVILKEYYKDFKLTKDEIKNSVFSYLMDNVSGDKSEVPLLFKQEVSKLKSYS
jgi:hypothetical protein